MPTSNIFEVLDCPIVVRQIAVMHPEITKPVIYNNVNRLEFIFVFNFNAS
jgi:hypothetical protein